MSSNTHYVPLTQDESPSAGDEEKSLGQPPQPTFTDSIIRWSILLILASCIFDSLSILYFSARQQAGLSSSSPAFVAFDDLPIKSSYIRLNELYSGIDKVLAPKAPITNLPRVVLQVDSAKPAKIHPIWKDLYSTPGGMVPYNERKVIIKPTVSTVAEFHVMDFGMENCSITLTTPPNPQSPPPRPDHSNHQPSHQGPEGPDTEILLDVWSLNSTYSIKQFQLSWLTKPSREAHLGILPFRWNTTVSLPGFPCKHGTYQNIELSCRSEECDVDVESTAREAIGVYIKQYQTV